MSLTLGMRLGSYEVVSPIGAGGMGEVYRARDTKLNREVAIKILPDVLAHDHERVARFTREAQTLAALNHPNIAQIHGIMEETAGGGGHLHALVMELVEGEDLSHVIARGALPPAEALPIAKQIADALEAAHEQGIIHRDLKPANIKVRADGMVKVLDFGLAKALDAMVAPSSDSMKSPTLTAGATQQGTILGTAAYMAPEQARGKAVDRRADTWAFGVVLYEMLTGRRAFTGDDVSVTLASVIKDEVQWEALPADLPPSVRRLLRRCLEKDPRKRLSAIGDARFDLEDTEAAPVATSPAPLQAAAPRRHRVAWVLSTMAALAALAAAVYLVATRGSAPAPARVYASLPIDPAETLGGAITFAPDGTQIVYVGRSGQTLRLYRRPLAEPDATPIPGTESVSTEGATFSPDGRWLAFRTNRLLKKAPIDGGPATVLATTSRTGRVLWGPNDTIIANAVGHTGLSLVPASGGQPKALTTLDAQGGELGHAPAAVLPGGEAFLYLVTTTTAAADSDPLVVAQTFDLRVRKPLFRAAWVALLPTGELLFGRGGSVLKIGFDARMLATTGDPAVVMKGVLVWGETPIIDVARDGTLAFARDDAAIKARSLSVANRLVTVSSSGAASPVALPEHTYSDPRVSPDGTRVAVHVFENERDNWVADLKRGTLMRLTFDPGEDETPAWSPDGRWIAYTSTRTGIDRAIYRKAADGSGQEEQLWSGSGHLHIGGFTPDGTSLIVSHTTGGPSDVATIGLDSRKMTPLLNAPYGEYDPALSPDGRWLAYTSDETGRPEVYVRSFPSMQGRWQVSAGAGNEPRWSRDGRRLYYRGSGKVVAVDVSPGTAFVPSAPKPLFDDRFSATQADTHTCYDTMPDGSLLMIQDEVERRALRHLDLILNWLRAPASPAKGAN